MATPLIDLFRSSAGNSLVNNSSAMLGESAASISTSIESIAAALTSSLIYKARTEEGSRELMQFINTAGIDEKILEDIPSRLQGGLATETLTSDGFSILSYLFADRLSDVVDWIAGSNGLKTSSANTLMKLMAPLMLGTLSKVISDNAMNAAGLKNYLSSQQEIANTILPSHILGLTYQVSHSPVEKIAHGSLEGPYEAPIENEPSTLSKLLPWIVLLIAALGLFYFLEKGGNPPPVEIDKVNSDSIENIRRMDSIRHQQRMDSIDNLYDPDSLDMIDRDTI